MTISAVAVVNLSFEQFRQSLNFSVLHMSNVICLTLVSVVTNYVKQMTRDCRYSLSRYYKAVQTSSARRSLSRCRALLSPLVTKHEHSTLGSGPGSVNAPDISAHISEINGKLRLKCHKLTFLFVYNLLADAVCLERKIYTVLFLDGKIQGKYEFPNVLTLSEF